MSGGYPIPGPGGYPIPGLGGGGYPIPSLGGTQSHVQGVPHLRSGGYPISGLGGYPISGRGGDLRWGTPQPDLGWGTPLGQTLDGVPPSQTWNGVPAGPGMGYPPTIQTWKGYPPRNVNRQTPAKTVPSRHTTYVDSNYAAHCLVTAHIPKELGRYCFHRCLSVHISGEGVYHHPAEGR